MKYRKLGRTGAEVSEICLGTMTWGSQNTEAEAHEQMDYALDHGVNFIDTAEVYPTTPRLPEYQGRTEAYIGSWLAKSKKRDAVMLATKITGDGVGHIRDGGPISAKTLKAAIETSLQRLRTDFVDLYQLHWPNRGTYAFRKIWDFDPSSQPRDETLENLFEIILTMGELVKAGKVRFFGISNDSAWGLTQHLKLSELHDLPRVASIQNEYSLMCRYFSPDLAEVCHQEDVSLLPYSSLSGGLLTGKYSGGAMPKGSRGAINKGLGGRYSESSVAVADSYVEIATKHGLDPAQMALAFTLKRPQVAATIIGATDMDQLKTNIGASDVTLNEDAMKDIDELYRAHPMPF